MTVLTDADVDTRLADLEAQFLTAPAVLRRHDVARRVALRGRDRSGSTADGRRLIGTRLPTAGEVSTAVGLVPAPRGLGQHRYGNPGNVHVEGRTFYLVASPGTIGLEQRDEARVDRATEREAGQQEVTADVLATYAGDDGDLLPARDLACLLPTVVRRGRIEGWSAKSRARMVRRIAQLDLAAWDGDGDLGMVTLTYPGRWQDVAPSNDVAMGHLNRFAKAYRYAFGVKLRCIWKKEFQRRGAPHFHLLMRVPRHTPNGVPFTVWLANTWAKIVAAAGPTDEDPVGEYGRHLLAGTGVDFTARVTDPRRIAVYFSKHGGKLRDDKEYQHIVPRAWQETGGAGRFWGYMGLRLAVERVEVDVEDFIGARRVLRRLLSARGGRKVWTLGSAGAMTGGTVIVNDGAAVTATLARYLAWCRTSRARDAEPFSRTGAFPARPLLP